MKKKAVIIIPTYEEAASIEQTIHEVFAACQDIQDKCIHLLIFDSHSQDETAALVAQLQIQYAMLHLQVEPEKTGLGSAYRQAMQYALDVLHADFIVEFDADLSHSPTYLPEMLRLIEDHDVVLASRYVANGGIDAHWPWYRLWLSTLGNYVARCLLAWDYHDFTSGFRVTRGPLLRDVLPTQFLSNHYAYKIELMWLLIQHGAKILEYPFVFVDRTLGHSKLPKNTIFDSLYVIFRLRLKKIFDFFEPTQNTSRADESHDN